MAWRGHARVPLVKNQIFSCQDTHIFLTMARNLHILERWDWPHREKKMEWLLDSVSLRGNFLSFFLATTHPPCQDLSWFFFLPGSCFILARFFSHFAFFAEPSMNGFAVPTPVSSYEAMDSYQLFAGPVMPVAPCLLVQQQHQAVHPPQYWLSGSASDSHGYATEPYTATCFGYPCKFLSTSRLQ